jgi:hypothetical protein
MKTQFVTEEPSPVLLAIAETLERIGIKLHLISTKPLTPKQIKEKEELIIFMKGKGFTFTEEDKC